MKLTEKRHSIDTVFVLILLSVFAVLSLMLVLIGGNAYRSIIGKMNANNEIRASMSYVANKVRAADITDEVLLKSIDGVNTLVIPEGDAYVTYIYYYEGKLFEYYTTTEDTFLVEKGDELVEVTDFSFSEGAYGIITIQATNSRGQSVEMDISQHA